MIGLVLAVLIASERGRAQLGRTVPRIRRRPRPSESADQSDGAGAKGGWKSSATSALARGSVMVALGVGVVLGVPGPFDVLALGQVVRASYALVPSIVIVVVFNLIKLMLIELPILSYAVDPGGTAARVDRFSSWMKANQMRVIAAVIGVIGLLLIVRGISRLGLRAVTVGGFPGLRVGGRGTRVVRSYEKRDARAQRIAGTGARRTQGVPAVGPWRLGARRRSSRSRRGAPGSGRHPGAGARADSLRPDARVAVHVLPRRGGGDGG